MHFDQLWDFFPKHRYGKAAATVRTKWFPVWTRLSIRQVTHSKFRRSDDGLHGPNTRASYMEISCIRFIVQTTNVMVRTRQALIWKLRAAKVQPFGQHRPDTAQFRKEFLRILESRSHSCPSRPLMSTILMGPRYFKSDTHLNLKPIYRGP